MALEVTTTVGAALIASQVVERAYHDAAYQAMLLPRLCKVINLKGRGTDTAKVPKMPKLTATAQTQGVDMTNSQFNPTSTNMTAAIYGLMITLLDAFMQTDILGSDPMVFIEQLGAAVGEVVETNIGAEVADSTTSIGVSGADFTFAQFLTGIYELLNGKAKGPFFFWGHPVQANDLRQNIAGTAGAIWGASAGPGMFSASPAEGNPQSLCGVLCVESTSAASVNADADRQGFMGPIGDRCALTYSEIWAPRVEVQRDASKIGDELVGSVYHGDENTNTAANGGIKVVTDHE